MSAKTRWIAIAAVTLLFVSAGTVPAAGGVESHPMIGQAAPEFDLETIAGDRLRLADLRGKYVVLHFGTSW